MLKTANMQEANKKAAFLEILQQYKGILYKISGTYCINPEDRKDLVQEIIIQLWNAFERYNPSYAYSTWIYKIALNVSISFLRKENSRKKITANILMPVFMMEEQYFENEKDIEIKILYEAIGQLKTMDKALMLLWLEEKSYKEIAEILGISETNVATKVGRTKIQLKEIFLQIKEKRYGNQ